MAREVIKPLRLFPVYVWGLGCGSQHPQNKLCMFLWMAIAQALRMSEARRFLKLAGCYPRENKRSSSSSKRYFLKRIRWRVMQDTWWPPLASVQLTYMHVHTTQTLICINKWYEMKSYWHVYDRQYILVILKL